MDSTKPVSIYALVDPRDEEVRYVGQSSSPNHRLSQHCHDAKALTTPLAQWIRELDALGLRPVLTILETVKQGAEPEAEARWLAAASGSALLNQLRPPKVPIRIRKPLRACSIEGCERPVKGRGWCAAHYSRWLKHGDPLLAARAPNGAGTVEKRTGYRMFTRNGKRVYEHKEVMERKIGRALRRGEVVHHLNEDKTDCRSENLELLAGQREHRLIHTRTFRSLTHKQCSRCREVKPRSEFAPIDPKGTGKDPNYSRCHACARDLSRERRESHPRPRKSLEETRANRAKRWAAPGAREAWSAHMKEVRARNPRPRFEGWARGYEQCQECGRSDREHVAFGLCSACYARQWKAASSA